MDDRERYRRSCGVPIHTPRRIVKARKKRVHRGNVAEVRPYVFARERELCRCCRKRPAESMHEIVFRSQGGKVSKQNSIAVCGHGTAGCHHLLQRHQIDVYGPILEDWSTAEINAEGTLTFRAVTLTAQEWLGVTQGQELISPVMVDIERADQ